MMKKSHSISLIIIFLILSLGTIVIQQSDMSHLSTNHAEMDHSNMSHTEMNHSTLATTSSELSNQALSTRESITQGITLPYYNSIEFTPHWFDSSNPVDMSTFHRIPDFSFTNQSGEQINNQAVANKIYIANFFFSTCPGICPSIRSKLTKVQDKFINDENVLILSHSIRPTTDTVEVLNQYAKNTGIRSKQWHLLTGDKDEIYKLAKDAYFSNEDLGNIVDVGDFLHTENLLLIDTNGHIRGIYNGLSELSIDHLIDDIEILKSAS